MALKPTIGDKPDNDAQPPPLDVYGWDWTATTHAVEDDRTVERLLKALGGVTFAPGKGIHGWSKSVLAYDAAGYSLGAVYSGGGREDCHVLATSAAADTVRPLVSDLFHARTSRVDTRVDTLAPFEELTAILYAAAETYNSTTLYMESRRGGKEALGRTLYLGAPSSAVRMRVYEKHLQAPGEYEPGTNRVEVQLRPPSKVKGDVSAWTPAQTFGVSKPTRDVAALLKTELAPKTSLHVSRGTPDLMRTMKVMGKQYGPAFEKFMEWSGGDLETVLGFLMERDEDPDPAAELSARLIDTRHALDSLGARPLGVVDQSPPTTWHEAS